MILAVDAGNSTVGFGLFEGEKLVSAFRAESRRAATPDEYRAFVTGQMARAGVEPGRIKGIVISSVVPPLVSVFFDAFKGMGKDTPLLVSARVSLGIKIKYKTPETLGSDRLASSAAAYAAHGGPVIVADFGTATTLSAVDGKGTFLGGTISPGLMTGYEALTDRAPGLPKTGLTYPKSVIGASTAEGLEAGVVLGHAGMVDGLLEMMREEMAADVKVVATGGLAGLVTPHMKTNAVLEQNLALIGLALIYRLNAGK